MNPNPLRKCCHCNAAYNPGKRKDRRFCSYPCSVAARSNPEYLLAQDVVAILKMLRKTGMVEIFVGKRTCSHSGTTRRRIRAVTMGRESEKVGCYTITSDATWEELGEMIREDVKDAADKCS